MHPCCPLTPRSPTQQTLHSCQVSGSPLDSSGSLRINSKRTPEVSSTLHANGIVAEPVSTTEARQSVAPGGDRDCCQSSGVRGDSDSDGSELAVPGDTS